MYSNLVKADYEIKDMNLKELREILVKQNNLTPLDILKGFHEESKFNLKYSSCITNENLKDIKLIQEEYKSYLSNKGKEIVQKIYDEKFNSMLAEYQKENADVAWNGKHEYYNVDYEKAMKFLDSLPQIESRLCQGGYIQDKNGIPCCDGDKVVFSYYDDNIINVPKKNGVLRWSLAYKQFVIIVNHKINNKKHEYFDEYVFGDIKEHEYFNEYVFGDILEFEKV